MNICMDESTGKGYTTYTIKENDIVVIRPSQINSEEHLKKIRETWSDLFKEQGYQNVKVIVLSNDLKIEVITKDSTGEITVD